jgi:hypothetical protein
MRVLQLARCGAALLLDADAPDGTRRRRTGARLPGPSAVHPASKGPQPCTSVAAPRGCRARGRRWGARAWSRAVPRVGWLVPGGLGGRRQDLVCRFPSPAPEVAVRSWGGALVADVGRATARAKSAAHVRREESGASGGAGVRPLRVGLARMRSHTVRHWRRARAPPAERLSARQWPWLDTGQWPRQRAGQPANAVAKVVNRAPGRAAPARASAALPRIAVSCSSRRGVGINTQASTCTHAQVDAPRGCATARSPAQPAVRAGGGERRQERDAGHIISVNHPSTIAGHPRARPKWHGARPVHQLAPSGAVRVCECGSWV